MLLKIIFEDYKEAWAPVMDVSFEYLDSEVNPAMANIVSPTEVVVISSFHIELDGGGGDFHIALPYSMLEPIRELLDAGVQSDTEDTDLRWSKALRDEIMDVEVDLSTQLLEVDLSLKQIMELKAGILFLLKCQSILLCLLKSYQHLELKWVAHAITLRYKLVKKLNALIQLNLSCMSLLKAAKN